MEDGLVLRQVSMGAAAIQGLNPCCNGRWSRTTLSFIYSVLMKES